MEKDWEEKLREQIRNVKYHQEESVLDHEPSFQPRKKKTTNTETDRIFKMFVIMIILLTGISFCAYFKQDKIFPESQVVIVDPVVDSQPKKSPLDRILDKFYVFDKKLTDRFDTLDNRMTKLEKRSKEQGHKIFLLGILNNQNMQSYKNGDKNSVMFLNNDWTIQKMPNYLDLDSYPKVKKELEESIR